MKNTDVLLPRLLLHGTKLFGIARERQAQFQDRQQKPGEAQQLLSELQGAASGRRLALTAAQSEAGKRITLEAVCRDASEIANKRMASAKRKVAEDARQALQRSLEALEQTVVDQKRAGKYSVSKLVSSMRIALQSSREKAYITSRRPKESRKNTA